MIQIYEPTDPLVVSGQYDIYGFTPKERRAQARKETQMAKRGPKKQSPDGVDVPLPDGDGTTSLVCPHAPPCETAAGCIRRSLVAAGVGSHRVTTRPSNGDAPASREVAPGPMSVGEAMRQAVEALGARTTDGGLSAGQLAELADCYERVVQESAAYMQKAEAAKVAKKAVESATEFLLGRIKDFTHALAGLPLFDKEQAEADQAAMVGAIKPGDELRPGVEAEH